MKKYFLTFHTIFIMDENVEWIEEFLIYYLNLGFEHFYLYDNTGSVGRKTVRSESRTLINEVDLKLRDGIERAKHPDITKYGFSIVKKNPDIWRDIYDRYKKYITYIKYQPICKRGNLEGQVYYHQKQNIIDFINEYRHETEWCFFGDFDEFIFSPVNDKLIPLIKSSVTLGHQFGHDDKRRTFLSVKKSELAAITFHQKIFLHRYLTTEKYLTQEYQCINNLSDKSFGGHKSIVNLDNVQEVKSVHHYRGMKRIIPIQEWRFNHYNLCPKRQRKIDQHKAEWKYELSTDSSMSRYRDLFCET